MALAERYRVSGYPTMILLDARGNEVMRRQGYEDGKELAAWLDRASGSTADLTARIKKQPKDIGLLWQLAQRARTSKDAAGERRWLARIEAADTSADRADARDAAWRRAELAVSGRLITEARAAALAYLRRYPRDATEALAVLAAAGADRKTLEAEYARVIAATDKPGELNGLVYGALGVGAFDAALAAAEKQAKLRPDDPNAYDSLAEVYNYRGDRQKAIATSDIGLSKKGSPELMTALRGNRERFATTGGPTGDVKTPVSFDRILDRRVLMAGTRTPDPVAITRHMLENEIHSVTEACAPKAKGLASALVRITIDKGAHMAKVEVLEPGVSPALRTCVVDALRRVKVPADNPAVRVLIDVPLAPPAAAPAH